MIPTVDLPSHAIEHAIESELEWASGISGARTRFVVAGRRAAIAPDVAQQLFRIVQEALANAVAHAGAGSIRVALVHGARAVAVIIEDDGCGFAASGFDGVASVDGAPARGSGLRDIRSRAESVGGFAGVESIAGWGTRVRADLPYSAADPSAAPRSNGLKVANTRLTSREREVRALVERGWPDKRVAAELGISVKTAEKHVGVILRKTGAANRTVLAARGDALWGKTPPSLVGESLI